MKKMLLTLFALATCISAMYGQSSPAVQIDLRQALDIALSDNPTIKIAQMEIERQDYVRKETWGNLLPSVESNISYQNALAKTTMKMGDQEFSFEPTNTVVFGGTISVPLFVPGVYQSLKLNREQMRAALESARASRITLSNEVRKSFYNVLRIDSETKVLRESQANIRKTVDMLQVGFDKGVTSEYDLLTAQVQLSNLDPLLLQADKGMETATMYLKMLLGFPLEQQVIFTGSLQQMELELPRDLAPVGANLSNNSDLRSMDIQEDILAQQIKVMRTQRMPTLGASLSAQLMGRNAVSLGAMAGGSGDPKSSFEWQHPMALSAGLSIPIFSGFTKTNRERQVKNSLSQLQVQRGYAQKQIEVAASSALNNVHTARERMAATSKTIEQAQKAYKISQVRYQAGNGTILELNAAELQLTQSQLNFSQAVYDLLSANADYQKILGNE